MVSVQSGIFISYRSNHFWVHSGGMPRIFFLKNQMREPSNIVRDGIVLYIVTFYYTNKIVIIYASMVYKFTIVRGH